MDNLKQRLNQYHLEYKQAYKMAVKQSRIETIEGIQEAITKNGRHSISLSELEDMKQRIESYDKL